MLREWMDLGTYHGDIKDFSVFHNSKIKSWFGKPKEQPENILVDYDFNGDIVSNFKCYLADWGTADAYKGGTPMYAGPRTYEKYHKDLFSTARLALELFLPREGKINTP